MLSSSSLRPQKTLWYLRNDTEEAVENSLAEQLIPATTPVFKEVSRLATWKRILGGYLP
jgi:hypothetical protein